MSLKKIPLPRGKSAVVDSDIYEEASKFRWCQHSGGYVQRWVRRPDGRLKSIFLHKLITGAKKGQMVKFRDENKLNLLRENLIVCTKAEFSHMNTKHVSNSRYRGVFWKNQGDSTDSSTKGKYIATIIYGGKPFYIGTFKKEKHAALAYDFYSRKFYKDKACVNFPKESITEEELMALKKREKKTTSIYRGVSFHEQAGMWRARIIHEEETVELGLYTDEISAAKAYDKAARKLKGQDAKVNFPRRN